MIVLLELWMVVVAVMFPIVIVWAWWDQRQLNKLLKSLNIK